MFRRDGASWDVGVHYIGELQKGSMMRALFDFLSDGALEWNRMPDEFERFVYPGLDFSVPSDPKRYQARLIARFPDEAVAIRRYFRDLRAVALWHILGIQEQVLPAPLGFLVGQWRRLGAAKATQTTGDYLGRHFKSPQLKALLASQWGDYGLPPSESAFALHAIVVSSYFNGGWYPQGGAGRLARTFELGIEARGGAIKVSHEVTAILTEGARAIGAKALDRRGAETVEVEFARRSSSPTSARAPPFSACCRPTAKSADEPRRRAPMSTPSREAFPPSRSTCDSTSRFPRSASRARIIGSTRRSNTTISTRRRRRCWPASRVTAIFRSPPRSRETIVSIPRRSARSSAPRRSPPGAAASAVGAAPNTPNSRRASRKAC